jgi:hypothetical protein
MSTKRNLDPGREVPHHPAVHTRPKERRLRVPDLCGGFQHLVAGSLVFKQNHTCRVPSMERMGKRGHPLNLIDHLVLLKTG